MDSIRSVTKEILEGDDGDQLVEQYQTASREQRDILNAVFMSITGFSLGMLIVNQGVEIALPPKMSISWHINDILGYAEDQKINITTKRAFDILEKLKRNHDCSRGISWETISAYLDNPDL